MIFSPKNLVLQRASGYRLRAKTDQETATVVPTGHEILTALFLQVLTQSISSASIQTIRTTSNLNSKTQKNQGAPAPRALITSTLETEVINPTKIANINNNLCHTHISPNSLTIINSNTLEVAIQATLLRNSIIKIHTSRRTNDRIS